MKTVRANCPNVRGLVLTVNSQMELTFYRLACKTDLTHEWRNLATSKVHDHISTFVTEILGDNYFVT